jgi:hypothetical protein
VGQRRFHQRAGVAAAPPVRVGADGVDGADHALAAADHQRQLDDAYVRHRAIVLVVDERRGDRRPREAEGVGARDGRREGRPHAPQQREQTRLHGGHARILALSPT